MVERCEHALTHALVADEHVCRDGDRLRDRVVGPRLKCRIEVTGLDPEDLERSGVVADGDQHGDVPAGHHAVDQPAACELHDLGDAAGDDVESIPHVIFLSGAGVKSRASVSPYSLNTSARGIEGSSNHAVSIPLTNAKISTALMAGSKSRR